MSTLRNRDFTPCMYRRLLEALQGNGYSFQTFGEFCANPGAKVAILRHDVDRKPENALLLAEIETEMGIRGSYHFRSVRASNDPVIVSKIADMSHEIAYHYEDLTLAMKESGKSGSDLSEKIAARAFDAFRSNLEYFRQYYPVRVISMHGSPAEKIDNRLLWKHFDYHEYDILCEPYFDLDYSDMLYLTDTGRRWDGSKYNIRDKAITGSIGSKAPDFTAWRTKPVRGSLLNMTGDGLELNTRYKIHSTKEIFSLLPLETFPDKLVINTHPQRWDESIMPWTAELYTQKFKNCIKRLFIFLKANKQLAGF